MTENVYVIKVKTKPPLSSLYPSERRYSALTVGGLSLIHFGLGALSLLLGAFALSLQGLILSAACLVPFATGLLAWQRWYIDRNIAIFFYGSLFSLIVASLCCVVTIFDIAAVSGRPYLWPLQRSPDAPHYSLRLPDDSTNDTNDITSFKDSQFNITDERDFLKDDESSESPNASILSSSAEPNESDLRAEASFALEERTIISREILRDEGVMNVTQGSADPTRDKVKTLWRNHHEDSSHARMLLTLNVLMSSLLEIFWSLLSARIAFRGMTNHLLESNRVVAAGSKATRPQKRKPPAPKPDILDHNHRLSESLQNFVSLQGFALQAGPGPRLPLPESSREFRERVERFLANQVTHRVVEGA